MIEIAMAKRSVQISASPGQTPLTYDGTVFRLATFPDAPALRWMVYGGEDGRVIVYNPVLPRWELLVPTLKAND
jgi:hypothetical protein